MHTRIAKSLILLIASVTTTSSYPSNVAALSAVKTCPSPAGWELAKDQKPSPVPYQEALWNEAIQLGGGHWRWNGKEITEVQFAQYLRETAHLSPTPLILVKFSSKISCNEKQLLQKRIADTSLCSQDYRRCLEGTSKEYRNVRSIP